MSEAEISDLIEEIQAWAAQEYGAVSRDERPFHVYKDRMGFAALVLLAEIAKK